MTFFAGRILTAAELNALETRIAAVEADSGWVNPGALGSGWTGYADGTYGTVRYRKIAKLVQVRGLVASSSIANAVFTLPAGFRPSLNLIFNAPTATWPPTNPGEWRVFTSGAITAVNLAAANTYASLSVINFFVD